MFQSARTLRLCRFGIVNIQKLIEVDRTLSHKKYQMMNTLAFAHSRAHPAPARCLEKNEVAPPPRRSRRAS